MWMRRLGTWLVLKLENGRTLRLAVLISLFTLSMGIAHASSKIESRRASYDVSADRDTNGDKVSGYGMEVRSRWTPENLYFLFICPYTQLYLKPQPKTDVETNSLWNWDVAETFIGSDFRNIHKYKEFEVSPQGEWVDLDINLDRRQDSHAWKWNSGFTVSARIDPATHRWYGFMKIPYSSVDSHPASAGNLLRINFFLSEGSAPNHRAITWQPTHQETFHVPKVFGIIKLR